eukprot:6186541-Pleurochrysis_carterae.AAC.1
MGASREVILKQQAIEWLAIVSEWNMRRSCRLFTLGSVRVFVLLLRPCYEVQKLALAINPYSILSPYSPTRFSRNYLSRHEIAFHCVISSPPLSVLRECSFNTSQSGQEEWMRFPPTRTKSQLVYAPGFTTGLHARAVQVQYYSESASIKLRAVEDYVGRLVASTKDKIVIFAHHRLMLDTVSEIPLAGVPHVRAHAVDGTPPSRCFCFFVFTIKLPEPPLPSLSPSPPPLPTGSTLPFLPHSPLSLAFPPCPLGS